MRHCYRRRRALHPPIRGVRIWGMPNWKSASEYAFTAKLVDVGWTWEFLRRNPTYRNDYSKAKESLGSASGVGPHLKLSVPPESSNVRLWWNLGLAWWIYGPIRDPARDDHPRFITGFPWQPNSVEAESFFAATPEESQGEEAAAHDQIPQLQRAEFALLVFDLRKRWGPQKSRASAIFKARQAALSKRVIRFPPHKGSENWPVYLRVLDAREAKVTCAEIAMVLFANEFGGKAGNDPVKKVEKYWAQAKRLRAHPTSLLGWSPNQSN